MKRMIFLVLVLCSMLVGMSLSVNAATDSNGNIIFPDQNLKAALIPLGIDTSNDGEISVGEARLVSSLNLARKNVTDLSGIEYFENLNNLNLGYNSNLSNISILGKLTNLTTLYLNNNNISDISSLDKLTNLRALHLNNNRISNISSLGKLTNLTNLILYYNNISDISSLNTLTNLTTLCLDNNNISDVSSLYNLTHLATLYLHNNSISDISSLSNLTNLTFLTLQYNNISDISSLGKLTNLIDLGLKNNRITNISSLGKLTNLMRLDLQYNNISDISSLSNLKKLTYLALNNNPINSSLTRWAVHREDLDFVVSGNLYEVWVVDNTQNNDLKSLLLTQGLLTPTFNRDTLVYSANVSNDTTHVQVTPTADYEKAIVKVNGEIVRSGQSSNNISIDIGTNNIAVVVIAENGNEKKYSIEVNRELSSIDQLIDKYYKKGLIKNRGIYNSLKQQISKGNTIAFMNHIKAQRGKGIDKIAADILLEHVQHNCISD